jgi:hypothetical protein
MNRAAWTYSRSRRDAANDHTTRAPSIQPKTVSARMSTFQSPPAFCETSARIRNDGTTSRKCTIPRINFSAVPLK